MPTNIKNLNILKSNLPKIILVIVFPEEKDEEQTSSDFTDAEFLVNGDLSSTNEEEPKLAKSFPWLTQFIKLCRAEIGVTNITTLENLMTVYLQ